LKIKVLNEDVIGKISAGEVVERPASVIKELVENSMDAGADSVDVEIQSGGRALIRVADNGSGMAPDDARMACYRHATSKITDIADLERVRTLGFRGEALASIAAVSQMELTSSAGSGGDGAFLYLESGQIIRSRPAGRERGTTVEVRNLFYNVPARRKFLMKESAELAEIMNVIGRFIVSYPGIEFKLTQGTRCLLHAPRNMDVLGRIKLVMGGDVSDHLVHVSDSRDGSKITGYVSRPSSTRRDRRAQMFFVNGRFVKSRLLSDIVHNSYRSMLERGRYPSAVLFLDVPQSELDVNVHPTKLQIKFEDERSVRDVISGAIEKKFDEIKQEKRAAGPDPAVREETRETGARAPVFAEEEVQTEFSYDLPRTSVRSDTYLDKLAHASPAIRASYRTDEDIFQVGDCYIVQIRSGEITITDQHAAHERILYEFFSKASDSSPVEVQNLLFPVRVELSASEAVIMSKVIENFRMIGFHIEPFGDRSYVVQAAPAILKDRDVRTVIYDILADLASAAPAKITQVDELVKLASCRAAIKAGDPLNAEEMFSLLGQLHRCELPFTCPHGRPTVISITVRELEKMFRRK